MYFMPLLVTVLLAADPEIVVTNVTLKEKEFDSFAEVLHVIQKSGTIEVAGAHTGFIEIEIYKNGKKLPDAVKSLGASDRIHRVDRARFALNVVDLDYMELSDGKKGHSRVHLKLGVGQTGSTTILDFPKKKAISAR